MVLADDDLDIDAEGVGRAEHLDDAASGWASGRRKAGDLDVDGQAFERSVWVFGRGPAPLQLLRFFAEHAVRRC